MSWKEILCGRRDPFVDSRPVLLMIMMVIMYNYCKRTDGSFSSSFLGLIMMTMMMIGLVVFLTLVKSRTTRLTNVFCSAVVLGEKE